MTDSFDILAAEHWPMLRCYIETLVHDSHIAEDLTQDTLISAQNSLDQFEVGRTFAVWLRGIARHKVADHYRATARHRLVIDSRIIEGMEEVYGPDARGMP